jgi:ABC-type transport system involved in multi-copper enzyme maturation permease subunit
MTFLPVVDRELRVIARRPGTYWTRLVFAMIAVGLAFLMMTFLSHAGWKAGTGGGLFRTIAVIGFGFCVLAGVFLTSDCVSEEKREGTLGFLFLTDLRGYDVVLGKLLANSLSGFYGVLAIFPVLAITLTLGGVTPGEFWRMVLVFINTLFVSLAAGVFVSSVSRQDNRAMAGTFALLVLVVGILPTTQFVLGKLKLIAPYTIALPSPLTAWQLAFDTPYRMWAESYWHSLGITQLFSWSLLVLASVLLPRIWQERPPLVPAFANRQFVAGADSPQRKARRAAMLDLNPVYWLVGRKHGGLWGTSLALGIVLFGGWSLYQSASIVHVVGKVFAGTGSPLLLRVLVGLFACRFFVELRRNGALELLLSTPLTVKDIVRGQWLALRRLFLFPVLAVLGLQLLVIFEQVTEGSGGWFFGAARFGWPSLFGTPGFIPDVFAAAWIGMLVGLTAKKSALAPGLTLLYAIALPGLLFCVPNLFIDIPVIFWARDKLYRELRQLSSNRYAPAVAMSYPRSNKLVICPRP